MLEIHFQKNKPAMLPFSGDGEGGGGGLHKKQVSFLQPAPPVWIWVNAAAALLREQDAADAADEKRGDHTTRV